jgi:hypothetical protein
MISGCSAALLFAGALGLSTPVVSAEPKADVGAAQPNTDAERGQETGSTPTATPSTRDRVGGEASARTVTITGCVQKETDVLGSGALAIGKDDEFVVIGVSGDAAMSADAGTPSETAGMAGQSSSEPSGRDAVGTSGSAPGDRLVYSLTGEKEDELERFVGKRVEVTGQLEDGDVAGSMTEGTTRPAAPGPGATQSEGQPESEGSRIATPASVNVASYREVEGSCPAR